MTIPFVYQDFHGGLNTKDAAFLLTDDEARDLSNVQATQAGAIVKRPGLVTFSSPASTLTSLFALETGSTSLVGAGGTQLFKITTGGVSSSLKTGLTNNLRWEFVSAPVVSGQGPLFGMNGTDTPQQWNGVAAGTSNWTNASGGVAVPNGKYCLVHQNQVFVAGVTATPSTLYWSAIADPTNWDPASLTGAGSMQFDPNDGQAITGIGLVGPYVLVAKPRKLFILVDPATATTRRLSDNVGCISHRSIASGSDGTYFLAEDRGVFVTNDGQAITGIGLVGPYVLVAKPRKLFILVDPATATTRRLSDNVGCISHRSIASGSDGTYFLAEDRGVFVTNGSRITPISDKIQPTIDSIQSGLKGQANGVFFNNHYYLSVPLNSANNDTTLDFDASLSNAQHGDFSWWKHSVGSNDWAIWHPSGVANLYSAKGTAAIVDQAFVPGVTVDNGTAFQWVWRGPWQSPSFYRRRRFPTPYFRKRLRQMRFEGSGTVDFSLAKDFAAAETLRASNIFGQQSSGDTFAGSGNFGAADSTLYGGQPSASFAMFHSLGVARAFSIVLSATSTTADTLLLYNMILTDRKDLVVS